MSQIKTLKDRNRESREERKAQKEFERVVQEFKLRLMEVTADLVCECMPEGHRLEIFMHNTGRCVIVRCQTCDEDRSVLEGSYESLLLPEDGSMVH